MKAKTKVYYYGARYYNPQVSVWLSVDPLASTYLSLSPYAFVANNPIMLVDPDGRKIDPALLDESNANYSATAAQAFTDFASSKEGQEFLKDYASEGQTIAGVTYSQGKYDKEGLSISFNNKALIKDDGSPSNANGETDKELKINSDGSLSGEIMVYLNTNGSDAKNYLSGKSSENDYIYDMVGTLAHESFIHGDYFAGDFRDGGGFDHSNVRLTINGSPHHYAADRAAKQGNGRFCNQGYDLMKKMNSKYKRFINNNAVWYEMWNFQY
jgi:RHS repeat-associated protein